MTNIAISALPVDASTIGASDIFPIVTGGVTKSITATLLGIQGWTNKSVLFTNSSGNLAQDNANFSYDSTAHKLSITNFQLGTSTTSGWVMTADASGNGTWVAPTGGVSSITGTANQVIASAATGAVTLSLPQSIDTNAGVSFARVGINVVTNNNNLNVLGNCSIGFANDPQAPSFGLLVGGSAIIGNTTADSSAKLAVVSTTKGFLPPVMSTTQKNAITAAAGLMVFDNVLNDVQFFNGTSWVGHSTTSTSIIGTANQVFANGTSGSGQTGIVTLTTPQDINTTSTVRFGKLGIGAALNTYSTVSITGSTAVGLKILGTLTALDNFLEQGALDVETVLHPTGGTVSDVFASSFIVNAATSIGETIAEAIGTYIGMQVNNNAGTITKFSGLQIQGSVTGLGSVGTAIAAEIQTPLFGNKRIALYTETFGLKPTNSASTSLTLDMSYGIVNLTSSSARSVSLPNANTMPLGFIWILKDAAFTAGTAPITITPSGCLIENAASFTIATNGGSVTISNDQINYFIY